MQTIRIQLRESTQESVELRYWLPQKKHDESRRLKLAEVSDLLNQREDDYYKPLPYLPRIGQQLFFWLDGDGRWLSRGIANCRAEGLVIAIDTDKKLAHLPWEVLHDGEDFLVKRVNPVVLPLRWIEKETSGFAVETRQLRVLFMATDPEDVEPKLDFEQEEAKILADTRDFNLDLRVEESGCVSELGKVWSRYFNDFDVFHLTGHASITPGEAEKNPTPNPSPQARRGDLEPNTPYFITETEIGDVPQAAIDPICEDISSWESHIQRAEILGLLEVTLTNNTERLYRVPRILSPLLEFPENPKGEELYKQAAQILYRLWWEEAESSTEAQRLEIHRLALLGKDEEIAAKIANSLAGHLRNQSRFREAIHLCKSTLEINKNHSVLREIAYCEHQMGEVDQALNYYEQALNLCPAEDEQELASIYYYFGMLKADKGEVDQAIALYNQSLEITERIGNVQGKASTLHCLGMIYLYKGQMDEAIALYNQSLEIKERIFDVQGKGATLHQLAGIYADKGNVDEAITLYNQSLEITERIGDVKAKAATLHCLAILYANKGEVDEAIALYNQSLEIFERIGNVQGKAATLHQLAGIYANKGEVDEAIALYNQSLEITERIGDVQTKAATLHQLAGIYADKGEVDEAIALYNQSLKITERIGNVQTKAATLNNLAAIYANKGEVDEAIALYNQSLKIKERIGDVQGKAATLHQLAGIYANKGELDEAIALYNQSLEIKERIGNVQGKAATLNNLGLIYAKKGEVDEAIALFNQSLEITERIGDVQTKAVTLHCLEYLRQQRGSE